MHLLIALRQRGRFAGFSLFVSNSSTPSGFLCYKSGNELPPLNFNTNCTTHGRYVIFYNERSDRIPYPSGYELSPVFTELCEVTVTGIVKMYIKKASSVLKLTITL